MLTKVHILQAMVFPVVMYGCESCTINRAKQWRTDAFELWCWRRLLRVPWTERRSNQEISREYSLEGLMLKLKLQYFGHLMRRTDSSEKTLMLGNIEGRRRRGRQRISADFFFFFFSTCYFTEEKLSLSSFKPSGYMAQPQKYIKSSQSFLFLWLV